jgi:hypothetical protein
MSVLHYRTSLYPHSKRPGISAVATAENTTLSRGGGSHLIYVPHFRNRPHTLAVAVKLQALVVLPLSWIACDPKLKWLKQPRVTATALNADTLESRRIHGCPGFDLLSEPSSHWPLAMTNLRPHAGHFFSREFGNTLMQIFSFRQPKLHPCRPTTDDDHSARRTTMVDTWSTDDGRRSDDNGRRRMDDD